MPDWLIQLLTGIGGAGATGLGMAWMFLTYLREERPFRQAMFEQCHAKHEMSSREVVQAIDRWTTQQVETGRQVAISAERNAECARAHEAIKPLLEQLAATRGNS